MGSTFAALRAGMKPAASATAVNAVTAAAIVRGSKGFQSVEQGVNKAGRVVHQAVGRPIRIPAATGRIPRASIIHTTALGSAPRGDGAKSVEVHDPGSKWSGDGTPATLE